MERETIQIPIGHWIFRTQISEPAQQALEQEKRNRNEVNSIYHENQVRQKEGEPTRSYDFYKANNESNQ